MGVAQPGALFLHHIRDTLLDEVNAGRLPEIDEVSPLGVTWHHTRPERTLWQAFVDLEGYRLPVGERLLITDDMREALDETADRLLERLIGDLREKYLDEIDEEG